MTSKREVWALAQILASEDGKLQPSLNLNGKSLADCGAYVIGHWLHDNDVLTELSLQVWAPGIVDSANLFAFPKPLPLHLYCRPLESVPISIKQGVASAAM